MMKKRILFLCLILMIGITVCSCALAAQTIKLDNTATIKLADSLVFNQTKNDFYYYKDAKNNVIMGYRVSDGQVALKDVKSTLKKSGYSGIKIQAVNGVDICSGSKKADGMTTYIVYFNTKDSHFIMMAFTYNASKSKSRKIVNNVVNSIEVTEPEPDPEAPSFSWRGLNGTTVSSATYGGHDLILIYMSYSPQSSNEYIAYYLNSFKSYMKKLQEKNVQMLVCLTENAVESDLKSYTKKYPSMVFGRVEEGKEEDMWTCLERMGYKKDTVPYPVVVLRSRNNRLRCYKIGSIKNAKTVVNKALEMANDNVPAIPPDPDVPIPEEDDDIILVDGGKYRIVDKAAILIGVSDESITELVIPPQVSDGTAYPVTKIAAKACKGLKKLQKLQIGSYVENIGKEAFADCEKLSTVVILTAKLTKAGIGKNAFKNMPDKPEIKCPSKVLKNYKIWLQAKGVPKDAKYQGIIVK